jgi:hypothetical protein
MGILSVLNPLSWVGSIAEKAADRLIPDKNKAQDQSHESAQTQANITLEGERQRNYFTPRSVLMYALTFSLIYGIVIQPFAVAFGFSLPAVDFKPAVQILLGLLGLGV